MQALQPWVTKLQRAFQQSVLSPDVRLVIDLGSLTKSDVESYSAALLRGRQGGWLSPNDCREMGWPRVDGADDLSPPNTSSAAIADQPADTPTDSGGKVIDIAGERHAAD
jgi:hypothetical protein